MTKVTAAVAASCLAIAISGNAHAEGFSYSHIGFGLGPAHGRIAGDSDTAAGFRLDGAFEFSSHVFAFVDMAGTVYEGSDPQLDEDVELGFTLASLGAGFNWPLSPSVDLVTGISVDSLSLDSKVDNVTTTVDFDGWGMNIGLRGHEGERWQWQAAMRYSDVEHIGSITSLTVGARYYMSEHWALGAELALRQYDEDTLDLRETSGLLTVRYEFRDRH